MTAATVGIVRVWSCGRYTCTLTVQRPRRGEVLRSIAGAQRAWLRVHTTDGYVEDAIVDGSTDSKALHAMRRFLSEVDRAK